MADVVEFAKSFSGPSTAAGRFWLAVKLKTGEINSMMIGDGPGMLPPETPQDRAFLWLTNRESHTLGFPKAHTMCVEAANVGDRSLAAQRIVEGGHEIATSAQIQAELKARAERRSAILAAQAANDKKRIVLTSPKEVR